MLAARKKRNTSSSLFEKLQAVAQGVWHRALNICCFVFVFCLRRFLGLFERGAKRKLTHFGGGLPCFESSSSFCCPRFILLVLRWLVAACRLRGPASSSGAQMLGVPLAESEPASAFFCEPTLLSTAFDKKQKLKGGPFAIFQSPRGTHSPNGSVTAVSLPPALAAPRVCESLKG